MYFSWIFKSIRKRYLSDKIINRLSLDIFENKVKNINKNNDKKKDKIVRRLEYKFSEDYNQKKTKNRTDSDDERSEKDEKIIKKKEETEVIIQNNNVGYKNIRESKIKNCECSPDKKRNHSSKNLIQIKKNVNNENDFNYFNVKKIKNEKIQNKNKDKDKNRDWRK